MDYVSYTVCNYLYPLSILISLTSLPAQVESGNEANYFKLIPGYYTNQRPQIHKQQVIGATHNLQLF